MDDNHELSIHSLLTVVAQVDTLAKATELRTTARVKTRSVVENGDVKQLTEQQGLQLEI